MSDYDAIVIGAGNGGLTSAATLAKAGKKVLLLEKHNIPGGSATSFVRGRFEFETALHQLSGIGSEEKPGMLRQILAELEVEDKLQWSEINNLYRVILPGQLDFSLPAEREQATAILQERFPAEKENIQKFYDMVYAFVFDDFSITRMGKKDVEPENHPVFFKYKLKTTQEVLDEFFIDPMLKLTLSFYWCYMGLPPDKLLFEPVAYCIFAYIEWKPYHIKGGSQVMSTALAETVIRYGGDIRFNCGAEKILVEDDRVKGVVTEHGDTFTSQNIISNISPIRTFVDMMDNAVIPESTITDMKNTKPSISAFTLYIGLDCTPEELGFTESMNVFYSHGDTSKGFEASRRLDTHEDFFILSCYTIDEAGVTPDGCCQIAAICLKYGDPWMQLPPDQYYETKYAAAETLLQRIEEHAPNIREHIEELEVATPLTHMRYLGHPAGAIYGFDQTPKDSGLFFQLFTDIEGLHFAGGWTGWDGFQPTLISGYTKANELLKTMKKGE